MIGFLGPEGTFTHIALTSFLEKNTIDSDILAFDSFFDLFHGLKKNAIKKIFIPIENSIGGDVFSVLEELENLDKQFSVTGELQFQIRQTIMANSVIPYADINTIFSHEQSIRQTSEFINQYCSQVNLKFCSSNSMAAEYISGEASDSNNACIGHKSLSQLYGLKILKENISNTDDNVTRFIFISDEKTHSTGFDKSSFVFSTQRDKPGSLADILLEFSSRSINLTRISSRPSRKCMGDYLFFIDCEGHIDDSNVLNCMDVLRPKCSYFKFLGSFKKGDVYD